MGILIYRWQFRNSIYSWKETHAFVSTNWYYMTSNRWSNMHSFNKISIAVNYHIFFHSYNCCYIFSELTLWLYKIVYNTIFCYDILFKHHSAQNVVHIVFKIYKRWRSSLWTKELVTDMIGQNEIIQKSHQKHIV